jgi:hypothetical protein
MEADAGTLRFVPNGARIVPLMRPGAEERVPRLPADADLMVRIATRLGQRRDAMVSAMASEMQQQLPGYGRLRGSGMDTDLRSAAAAVCDIFISLLAERRTLSMQEERMLRALGARRARQGVPIELLRGAVHAVSRVGWRYVVACCVELGGSAAVLATMGAIGDELADFAGVTLRVMSSAYHSAPSESLERSEILAEALSGPAVTNQAASMAAAEQLERRMHGAHALVLVSAVDAVADADSAVTRAAVDSLLSQFSTAVEVPITWAVTAHATIAVPLTSPAWAKRASVLRGVVATHAVHLFVTAPAARVASLRCAYERATALLRVVRVVSTVPGVVGNADMRLYHLTIEGASDHQAYLDEVLGPILRQPAKQRDRLLETLVAFRDTSLRAGMRGAARALGVHEKTVAYRTERIVELTGLDPDIPHHRAQLIVAVDLLALQGWAPVSPLGG